MIDEYKPTSNGMTELQKVGLGPGLAKSEFDPPIYMADPKPTLNQKLVQILF